MTEIRNDSLPDKTIYGLYTGSLAAPAGMIYAYVARKGSAL